MPKLDVWDLRLPRNSNVLRLSWQTPTVWTPRTWLWPSCFPFGAVGNLGKHRARVKYFLICVDSIWSWRESWKRKGLGFVERQAFAAECCRPWRPDCTGCQGEEEATALKERMSEETKVMMAVRTPSFQSWIQRYPAAGPRSLVSTCCYCGPSDDHVPLLSASCSWGCSKGRAATVHSFCPRQPGIRLRWPPGGVCSVESLIREKKMSVIRSRMDFKIKSLPVA